MRNNGSDLVINQLNIDWIGDNDVSSLHWYLYRKYLIYIFISDLNRELTNLQDECEFMRMTWMICKNDKFENRKRVSRYTAVISISHVILYNIYWYICMYMCMTSDILYVYIVTMLMTNSAATEQNSSVSVNVNDVKEKLIYETYVHTIRKQYNYLACLITFCEGEMFYQCMCRYSNRTHLIFLYYIIRGLRLPSLRTRS